VVVAPPVSYGFFPAFPIFPTFGFGFGFGIGSVVFQLMFFAIVASFVISAVSNFANKKEDKDESW